MSILLSNFLISLSAILSHIINIYSWLIIIRIILSWLQISPYSNQIVHFFYVITEPFLKLFRKLIPPFPAGTLYLDLSPILALLALRFIDLFLLQTIRAWGYQLAAG